ncbi:MAG: altronate dehydratase family protein [Desulfobacterales bacterium]|jgi:altronate hydrolase
MNEGIEKTVKLSPEDNVVVALSELTAENILDDTGLHPRETIPSGHKVAVSRINNGEPIIKYGQIIGLAAKDILPGMHVHTHNTKMLELTRDYAIGADVRPVSIRPESKQAHFQGFIRSNGQVGTRNYIGILATVSCSASVAHFIADAITPEILARYPMVDGVVALGHGSGCCSPEGSEGLELLQRSLAGYARNPNFGGIVFVGLGCEVNYLDCLLGNMNLGKGPFLKTVNIQHTGGTTKTVRRGVEAVRDMLPEVSHIERRPVSAAHIMLGLECGGSDGYSGISANPALGKAVDILVQNGGTAILSETPEIYGAEHLLTRRAVSREVAEKLIARIQWWEKYTQQHHAQINNNPSPGNKAGGLTTILEKSLGAVAKAGTTNLVDVYRYAEAVNPGGLVFMDTPGYDVVSITGMIAGGANMLCFTTGRGSVCGFKPAPTLKLATNSEMYERMRDDMDVNCGLIIEGHSNIEEMGEAIFDLILQTASGKKSKSETLGFGDNEFVPWHMGAIL